MRKATTILGVLLAVGAMARPDSVTVKKLPYSNVSIIEVREGKIAFRLASGLKVVKPLSEVTFVEIGRQGAFAEAEGLVQKGKHRQAVSHYETARREHRNGWESRLVQYRYLSALDKAGMIGQAVTEWFSLAEQDKFCAETLKMRPQVRAAKGSAENIRAVALLEGKLKNAKHPAYVEEIRQLLLKLYSREGLTDKAKALAKGLVKSVTEPRAEPGKPVRRGRTIRSGKISTLLGAVNVFLKQSDGASALQTLDDNIHRFDTGALAEALLMRGQARMMLAEQAADPDESRKLLLRAGLDFMRVVAHYPDSIDAGEALYRAGRVNVLLPEPNYAAARKAYQQVVSTYGETAAAAKARQALRRLKGGSPAKGKRRSR